MNGRYSKLGHLIGIYDSTDNPNGFIFLSISGEEDTRAVVSILEGIRGVGKSIKKEGAIKESPVLDFGDILYKHPETEGLTIHIIPMEVFWDNKKKQFKERLFKIGVKNLLYSRGGFFPTNFIGGVVTGSDFFDREKIIDRIWKALKEKSVIISAPRRFGKTSLLFALKDEPRDNYKPVHIDLEAIASPSDFVSTFAKRTGETFKVRVSKWQQVREPIFKEIVNKPYLLLLDEFSFMLDNFYEPCKKEKNTPKKDRCEKEIDEFLKWFASMIKRSRKCRCVIISSIDLSVYLKDKGLHNYFPEVAKTVNIKHFDQETSRLFVESLLYAHEIYLEEEIIEAIVKKVAPAVPYFLQIFTGQIVMEYRKSKSISKNDIDRIYENKLLGPDCRRYMDDFDNHIEKHYGAKRAKRARSLLNVLCQSPQGATEDELKVLYIREYNELKDFEILLRYLEYDFYIQKGGNIYRFASPILREYWERYKA